MREKKNCVWTRLKLQFIQIDSPQTNFTDGNVLKEFYCLLCLRSKLFVVNLCFSSFKRLSWRLSFAWSWWLESVCSSASTQKQRTEDVFQSAQRLQTVRGLTHADNLRPSSSTHSDLLETINSTCCCQYKPGESTVAPRTKTALFS